ncbi:MAG: carbamoyl phosphate synthase small subunit [Oscillospiraceae bacterium]|nr:carbamoyl phosphate synthase small subunit [Oscillospiraceae bacterium]
MQDLYLILESGAVFKGKAFGYDGEAIGELVFSTGMTGYLETLSDPAYYGQIVLQTFPLIGNYGAISEDFGPGAAHLKAYIVRDWCQEPSNFRSEGNLDSFLRKKKIPGLFGIDTRKLTREIREHGTMNAIISKTPELTKDQLAKLKGYKVTGAVEAACGANGALKIENKQLKGNAAALSENSKFNVVVWDFGGAYRLAEVLTQYGFNVSIAKFDETAQKIIDRKPCGVALSGGPGDPTENSKIISEIKALCKKDVPIFAVGLGHQLLALAHGAKTQKLHFGHRGANQAVKEVNSTRAFVSTQNHGYAVVPGSLKSNAVMSHENVNDGTCEGIEYKGIPAFSIQFDPNEEILEKFKTLMEGGCTNAAQ